MQEQYSVVTIVKTLDDTCIKYCAVYAEYNNAKAQFDAVIDDYSSTIYAYKAVSVSIVSISGGVCDYTILTNK